MKITFAYYGRYQVRESVEIEYLSAIAKHHGHEVSLSYDPGTFGVTDNVLYSPWLAKIFSSKRKTLDFILRSKPEVVVFSVSIVSYKWSCEIARKVKSQLNIPIVFIGLHPSLVPEEVMSNSCVDYVIQGETEGVFNAFLDVLSGKQDPGSVGNLSLIHI